MACKRSENLVLIYYGGGYRRLCLQRMLVLFQLNCMVGVSLMVIVVGLGSEGPEFKSCFAVELTPGGVKKQPGV